MNQIIPHGNQFLKKCEMSQSIVYNRTMKKNMITQYFEEIETKKKNIMDIFVG